VSSAAVIIISLPLSQKNHIVATIAVSAGIESVLELIHS
jgi:hypothetical protein